MNKSEASKLAINLIGGGFRVYGLGNFDIMFEDLIDVLVECAQSKAQAIAIYEKLEQENLT